MQFIGVAGRDDESAMQSFVDRHGLTAMPHIRDESGDIWSDFGITSQPAWIFVDNDGSGEVVVSALGMQGLTERVEALVAA